MNKLADAMKRLQEEFTSWDWTYRDIPGSVNDEKMYYWPGPFGDEIMITVHKSTGVQELFHRHDFYFFNFTYKGQYDSLSHKYDNRITIRENELYAGQPFAGHALMVHNNEETIIIGVLIKKETFFRLFLPMLSSSSGLFKFFIDPVTNSCSDEYLHFLIEDDCGIKTLLELMVVEYANRQGDTQSVLKSLALAFLRLITRQYERPAADSCGEGVVRRMLEYMDGHLDNVSLKSLAEEYSYHPNYVSAMLRRETGSTFSQIVLTKRMRRAVLLLKGTDLPVDEIASMLGYSNSSNFYKAFRNEYSMSPREYISREASREAE